LKARIEDRQKELADNEQLEAVACLLSGKAGGVEAIDYEHPARNTVRLWEKGFGKDRTMLAHQASLQVLVSLERLQVG
jgi:hypothetical protein